MTDYQPNPRILAQVHQLHAQGFSNRVIAEKLSMGKTTVGSWLKRYPLQSTHPAAAVAPQPADPPAPAPIPREQGVQLVLDPITVDGMDVEARIQGCSRSDVIAQALRLYLAACHRARNNMNHPIPLTAYLPVT